MKKLLEIIDIFHIKISAIALFVLAALFGYIKPLLLYFLIAFIHELCHLIEFNHGDNFKKLMDKNCPKWREIKKL